MIKSIKKLPFPDFLLNTDCKIKIDGVGITKDGEPNNGASFEGKCIFSEKAKIIITPDGQKIELVGKVMIKGDIAPTIEKIAKGDVLIGNKKLTIYSSSRPRNPDGTIHHTTLDVM